MEARRITGRHLLLDGPGAAIDVPEGDGARVAARALDAARVLGWPTHLTQHAHATGVTLAVRAPIDVLYAATAMLEWAAEQAPIDGPEFDAVIAARDAEANPRLRELVERFGPAAAFVGEDELTLGLGKHGRSWPVADLPAAATLVDPPRLPVAYITGTNGKTTTTRILARLVRSAGLTPGYSSSDAIVIGEEVLESGDWTGPWAARRVLRDPRVDVALLETARGGILRRGLVLDGADVAVVTNVTPDHFGEWGVDDLPTMARAKLVVGEALREGGVLVSHARCAVLVDAVAALAATRPDLTRVTFADEGDGPHDPRVTAWADATTLHGPDGLTVPLADIPATIHGTARHNVENALAASLAAWALGLSADAIAHGLRAFRPSLRESRGRLNRYRLPSGALVVLDFAHNPDGVTRVVDTVRAWPAVRRTVLVGQAGDRSDDDLRDLALAVAPMGADRVVLKELSHKLRGRELGEVPAILRRELIAAGVAATAITAPTPDETSGVEASLDGLADGDLALLLVHEALDDTLAVLAARGAVALDG